MIVRGTKYDLVGRLLSGRQGVLLDLGARDERLKSHLPGGIEYRSVERNAPADHQWNLEEPLPLADRSVDFIAALDVLEHLERMHDALFDLLRVARSAAVISLPNLSCLSLRWQFLRQGELGGKYTLPPDDIDDRHRWLTTFDQIVAWVEPAAATAGFHSTRHDLVDGFSRTHALFSRLPLPAGLRAYTVLYFLERMPA